MILNYSSLPDVPVFVEEGGVAAEQAAGVPLLPGAAVVHQQNIPAKHYTASEGVSRLLY